MNANSLAFYDFSGGINTSATKVMLGYGTKKLNWDDSYNVQLYKNQGVERMMGNKTFILPENSGFVAAICEYPKGTDGFIYVLSSGKVMRYINSLKIIEQIHDFGKEVEKADFAHYLDGVVIIAKDAKGVYYNENYENKITLLNATGQNGNEIYPEAVGTYSGRIWLAADSTLYFSALGRVNDWQSENDAGYIANFHSSVSKICAIAEYCGNLAIFKPDGVFLLSGTSPDTFSIIKFADKGTQSSKTVCTCNNKQYFVNPDGLFCLSQSGELQQIMMSGNIAYPVQEQFAQIDRTRMNEAFCVPYEKKNQIWFYLPLKNNDKINTIFIYDFVHNAWLKRVEEQNLTASANVFGEIIAGCDDGRILSENIGSTFDGKPIKFRFSTPFFHLGKPSERKIIEDFALLLDDTGENRFKFSVSKDFIKDIKSDTEYIQTTQSDCLVWADASQEAKINNYWENKMGGLWSRSIECALGVQIFDSNLSVALHIEGEQKGDDFKLVGIEFKELLNDY